MTKHQGHIAKKRFGQHFLSHRLTIDAIVDAIAPRQGQFFVEIGPGLGALTQPLLTYLSRMTVIELDRDLAARLAANPCLNVVSADVLSVDFANIARTMEGRLRVVGNLPYNISTPILFYLMQFSGVIEDQHFMLQKEVVERMVAPANCAAYGRLSVMLQARYTMENVLTVGPDCFSPAPRVDSAVVRMVPHSSQVLDPRVSFGHLEEMVRVAFSQRRKLLRHTLGDWLSQKGFQGSFDLQRRAQEVTVAEYLALAEQTKLQPE